MNEARYLQAFADATDAFLRLIGVDAGYLAAGGSYFTVETHIRHLGEARAGEPIATDDPGHRRRRQAPAPLPPPDLRRPRCSRPASTC